MSFLRKLFGTNDVSDKSFATAIRKLEEDFGRHGYSKEYIRRKSSATQSKVRCSRCTHVSSGADWLRPHTYSHGRGRAICPGCGSAPDGMGLGLFPVTAQALDPLHFVLKFVIECREASAGFRAGDAFVRLPLSGDITVTVEGVDNVTIEAIEPPTIIAASHRPTEVVVAGRKQDPRDVGYAKVIASDGKAQIVLGSFQVPIRERGGADHG